MMPVKGDALCCNTTAAALTSAASTSATAAELSGSIHIAQNRIVVYCCLAYVNTTAAAVTDAKLFDAAAVATAADADATAR